MTTAEIREAFLGFFEERGHKRIEGAPLVPAAYDPSVLFTIAGMHPLKPYFLGLDQPPHNRLTSCQPCFRTPDIDIVGTTTRHLTFFEMLGNFSIGDYFKQGAVEFAWEASLDVFGFNADDIWITVFEGDEELGLGPDEEAIEAWLAVGVPRERIVACNRKENFWQSGPTGPCGPCSELYLDRGVEHGKPDDLPGEENERFLEYWNLVFMQFNQDPVNVLKPLPAQHIDTGLGLNRMALIQQGTETIFETDDFKPLIELGEQLSGKRYGEGFEVDRALRVLADHTRAMTFLVADGVVPSNEDRGYVLRRIMRRAIFRGRQLGIEPGFPMLSRYADVVTELMGSSYPRIAQERDLVQKWLRAEEESFNRTLEQGTKQLNEIIKRSSADEGIGAEDAFLLHDTYGFPFDLTREMVTEAGLGVDEAGFAELMEQQRARARAASVDRTVSGGIDLEGPATEFTGYQSLEEVATVTALRDNVLKLDRSPFYAKGGGQIADAGVIACESGDCRARVVDVLRSGDDQARDRRGGGGRAARGREGDRARRPRGAPRDRGQPHRDAPAARRAARAPRHARAPGGLLRRPGQAALRLHPQRRAQRPRSCATSRTASTSGSSATTSCCPSRPRSTRRGRRARWRCSARSTATSCGWSRSATAPTRASCAAARTSARRPRSACSRSPPRRRVPRTSAASRR